MGKKVSTYTSTWTVASQKTTEFGFYYRWYLPKFVYGWVMHDLQYIRRNKKLTYKKAGYKPKTPIESNLDEKM